MSSDDKESKTLKLPVKKLRLKPKQSGGLVLWRSRGKSIQIGDDIFITVLKTEDGQGARLRIQAPLSFNIRRVDQIG